MNPFAYLRFLIKNAIWLLLIVIALYSSSCVSYKHISVGAGADVAEEGKGNFVKMKTGKELTLPDNIEVQSGTPDVGSLTKLKIGSTKINAKGIDAFQINGDYYKNYGKRTFARRIYKGPLNVYENTSVSTTTSNTGRTSTHYTTNYFVQKAAIDKGNLRLLSGTGKQEKLPLYIGDQPKAMAIYNKYRSERHTSRIVKFATLGLWLSSIPILMTAKEGTSIHDFGIYNAAAGLFYMPIMAVTFKGRNHSRPYKAVQAYIDNAVPADAPPRPIPVQDSASAPIASTAATPDAGTSAVPTNQDFLEVDKRIIVADDGTKLRSANNKFFTLNGTKYTTGVTAYQMSKRYYKRFPDMKNKDDFAQRSIAGKISVYNVVSGSQNTGNIRSTMFLGSKANLYFEKTGEAGFIKKPFKLAPYFADNAQAAAMYEGMLRGMRTTKAVSYGLSAASIASIILFFTQSRGSSSSLPYGIAATGLSLANYGFVKRRAKKAQEEFVGAIDYYNRR